SPAEGGPVRPALCRPAVRAGGLAESGLGGLALCRPAVRAVRPAWGVIQGRVGGGGVESEGERGAAVIEFVLVFLVLVVPLVYAIVVMADVQRALLAVSTAAREVGRVYVTATTVEEADRRTALAYAEVLENFGYARGDPRARLVVRAQCGGASRCAGGIGPGAEVLVRVTYRVPVARLPFIGAIAGPDLPIGATHHIRVDRYRGIGP
ncbi:MAG TPA: hypothetical protein VFA45_14435, partial [Actinomycetes bacterium]|nr:hypothetical protein [Actinomycetes bacterium]